MGKMKLSKIVSAFLLLVAASGMTPACWLNWYQPQSAGVLGNYYYTEVEIKLLRF